VQNIGIGTDIVEISRFENINDRAFAAFLIKNFTQNELNYCRSKDSPAPHMAVRFAGKEAVIKALYGLNITNIFYPAIEIINNNKGMPYVNINTDYTEKLDINLSLSFCSNLALAFCVIIQEI
jgi:holo-[acyl-carrier protein] synthase